MKYVSGPEAVVRLVNKKGHPIYIFGDRHENLNDQLECPISEESVRIDHLFKRAFYSGRKIGFFLEVSRDATQYLREHCGKRLQPYLASLRCLFADNVTVEKGKIQKSEVFPNVMFHHVDIRLDLASFRSVEVNLALQNIEAELRYLRTRVKKKLASLEGSKDYSKVIMRTYRNKGLGEAIRGVHEELHSYAPVLLEEIRCGVRKQHKYYEAYQREKFLLTEKQLNRLYHHLETRFLHLQGQAGHMYVMINDLFLLRRLLDKDYGTEVDYVYCGGYHLVNLVLFMLKYTDYKITHCTGDVKAFDVFPHYGVSWFLANVTRVYNTLVGRTDLDEDEGQCVDMTGFPHDLQ